MFTKKKPIESDPAVAEQVDRDLIVRNMPPAAKLSGASFRPDAAADTSGFLDENETSLTTAAGETTSAKGNFQTVGLLIMASGVIAIGGLAYLSYHFIIAPTANQAEPATAPVVTENNPSAPDSVPAVSPVATTTDLAATASVDLATTASTTVGLEATSTSLSFPDSDNDGLNDSEEAIFGTSATSTDTDADGYSDSAEIINGYDPSGPGKLKDNVNLATYKDKTYNYELLYPKAWPSQSLNNEATVIFTAPDNSLLQISVQDNPEKAGILSWYEENFPNITYDQVKTTASWEGIKGENGLNFYLTSKARNNIFVVSYIPALEGRLAYPNIFQLMINSLVLK